MQRYPKKVEKWFITTYSYRYNLIQIVEIIDKAQYYSFFGKMNLYVQFETIRDEITKMLFENVDLYEIKFHTPTLFKEPIFSINKIHPYDIKENILKICRANFRVDTDQIYYSLINFLKEIALNKYFLQRCSKPLDWRSESLLPEDLVSF